MKFVDELERVPFISDDPAVAEQAFHLSYYNPGVEIAGHRGLSLAMAAAKDMRYAQAEGWEELYAKSQADAYNHGLELGTVEGYTLAVSAAYNHCLVLNDTSWTERLASAFYEREDLLARTPSSTPHVAVGLQMLGAANYLFEKGFDDLDVAAQCYYNDLLQGLLRDAQNRDLTGAFRTKALSGVTAYHAYLYAQKAYDECLDAWPSRLGAELDSLTADFEQALIDFLPRSFGNLLVRACAADDLLRWMPENKQHIRQRSDIRGRLVGMEAVLLARNEQDPVLESTVCQRYDLTPGWHFGEVMDEMTRVGTLLEKYGQAT